MKKIIVSIAILSFISIAFVDLYAGLNPTASITWNKTTIDFGEVPFNNPVSAEFNFNNSGMMPVIISDVKPSCGCTVAEFPKQPISSGEEGEISVTFDAKTTGYFSKTITVHSNIQGGITQLYIKGTVVK